MRGAPRSELASGAVRALGCVAAFVLAGCGSGDRDGLVRVAGRVLFEGKPLPTGMVLFAPESNRGAGTARIDAGGRFATRLTPGNYVVVVRATNGADMMDKDGNFIQANSLVPVKYCDAGTSGLTLTVAPGMKSVELALEP
ncbi:MAG: hypothetical protein WCR51_02385 [Planctomycetia bacterium]